VSYRMVQGIIGAVLLGALVLFTAFPSLKPDWIQIGSGRGERGASTAAQAVSEVASQRAETRIERASEHILDQEWSDAARELTEAIRLDPKNAEAYRLRGEVWQSQGKLTKAVSDFDVAIRLDPEDDEALRARAEIRTELGEIASALADLSEVIRLVPNDIDALFSRATLREDTGDHAGAAADYQEVSRLNPEDSEALKSLAWVLSTAPDAKVRDGQRALKAAMKAVELDESKNWKSLDTLAAACAELRKFDAAERCEMDAIKVAPKEKLKELETRLDQYRLHKPYRQTPPMK
jgi:tetratricopeptide (TPR) repeat protein